MDFQPLNFRKGAPLGAVPQLWCEAGTATVLRLAPWGLGHELLWLVVEPYPSENMKVNWDDYSQYK